MFRFKDLVTYDLVSGVVYKSTCGRGIFSYYGKTERHLKLGLVNIKRVRHATTFYNVIMTFLLTSLSSYHTEIKNIYLKLNKVF